MAESKKEKGENEKEEEENLLVGSFGLAASSLFF